MATTVAGLRHAPKSTLHPDHGHHKALQDGGAPLCTPTPPLTPAGLQARPATGSMCRQVNSASDRPGASSVPYPVPLANQGHSNQLAGHGAQRSCCSLLRAQGAGEETASESYKYSSTVFAPQTYGSNLTISTQTRSLIRAARQHQEAAAQCREARPQPRSSLAGPFGPDSSSQVQPAQLKGTGQRCSGQQAP